MFNQLHSSVLDFAENYRLKHPDFTYALRKANRRNRFEDGLWFQGTERYVFMGLINRSGGTNMTKSLGLVFRPNDDDVRCDLEIVHNEEKDKTILKFYKTLIQEEGDFRKQKETKYIKFIASTNGFAAAEEFLNGFLPKLNSLIKNLSLERILISHVEFDESLAKITEYKNEADNTNNYWVFQGNPKVFDFEGAIKSGTLKSWTVSAHRDKIKPGDKVILWITGPRAGCYALAQITSHPYSKTTSPDQEFYQEENKIDWQVDLNFTHDLHLNPILWENAKKAPNLKNLKAGNQGTNFTSTSSEYEAFLKIANGESNHSRQYWLIAPGEQASMWNDFYQQGIIAIGWHIGDIKQYKSQSEIERKLDSNSDVDKNHRVNAQQCFEFGHDIKLNDIIIAKKGMSQYLGWGIVSEEYSFHPEKTDYQHVLKVDWKSNGSWEGEIQQRKTVTNISTNSKLNSVLKLLKIPAEGSSDAFYKLKNQFDQHIFELYIENLRTLLSKTSVNIDSRKVSFSVQGNRINFIVGQRYALCMAKKRNNTNYFFISDKELECSTGPFDGGPLAYYNETEDFNDIKNNLKSIEGAIISELNRTKISGHLDANNNEFRNYVFQQFIQNTSQIFNSNSIALNTILYGPPGTGKTYQSVRLAAEIVENRSLANYYEALEVFNKALHDRIEFITFHQNYSYEDFIQGLRPEVDNKTSLTFNKVDGVFKRISDKAFANLRDSEKKPEELSNELLFQKALDLFIEEVSEFEEPYSINKTAYILDIDEEAFRYNGEKWTGFGEGLRMKFSDLKEFFNQKIGTRKDIKSLIGISGLAKHHATYYFLVYEKILKHLPKKVEVTNKIDRKNYVIVIDEINRANISRVFGELITLIEPDKRSHGATPFKVKLPSGDVFQVPSNLFIIGTMNTADKSIALIDIALRRRFEFKSMFPLYQIDGATIHDEDVLRKINTEIIRLKSHDFQIGHSYFMEEKDLVKRMNNRVIPLLLEYFMNDDKTVTGILNKAGLQVEKDSWPIQITGRHDISI